MKKAIIFLFFGMFLISFASAINCNPKIKIEIGIYDEISENNQVYFEKSLFQPMGFGGIIKEGDYFFIEFFSFSVNNSCHNLEKSVRIKMKSPEEDNFSSIVYIPLENSLEEDGLIKYSFELGDDLDSGNFEMYEDNRGESVNFFAPKRLRVEGKWEMKVLYGEKEMHSTLFNEGRPLSRELGVRNRLEVQKLEEAEKESSRNFSYFLITIIVSVAVLLVSVAGVYFMKKTSGDQVQEMQKHYDNQTKKDDKREEEKQLDLLRTLLTELTFLEKNLNSYKETFSKESHYPFYELWDIDVALYFKGLSHKIKNYETISLKENLMIIRDKVLMINNLKVRTEKFEKRSGEELVQHAIKINREKIIKIIDEDLLPVINKSKKFILKKFNLKMNKK